MKKASRFMPKYEPRRASKLALFALLPIAVAVFIYQPWYLLAFVGLVSCIMAWGAIEQPKVERHFQQLRKARCGLSICEFARAFDLKVVDTWVIRAVYEQLQAALPTEEKVPIKATDSLYDTLMLDEDDLELSLIEEIAQRTNRSLEGYESNPYYGKVTTAKNLVLFFNHQSYASPRG